MGTYVDVPTTDTDQDSPVKTAVVTQLNTNTKYNHDHALRCGYDAAAVFPNTTEGVPVRLAVGQGWTGTGVGEADTGAAPGGVDKRYDITFNFSSFTDGDPNYDSAPTVMVQIERNTANAGWDETRGFGAVHGKSVCVFLTGVTASTAYITVAFENPANADTRGYINVIAIGPVTSGE